MAIRTDLNWDQIPENQGGESLKPDGYVAKIVKISDIDEMERGAYLLVEYDIAEGPFAGYYQRMYQQYQKWNGRVRLYYRFPDGTEGYGRIKALKTALEESNRNLRINQFDQRTLDSLLGALFGVLLGYDKKEHKYLNCYQVRSAEKIRQGDFKIPNEWKIHADTSTRRNNVGGYGQAANGGYGGGYGAPPPADDNDFPF